ncbi:MAG: hypothetical protein KA164_09890 [Rhodoferax sp.]|nr:hypothetical protein [Rhodoferax sp.]
MTTAQVAAIETRDVAVISTSQVAALTTAGTAALTTAQVQALTTAGVVALKTTQVAALTTDQVAALTTAQVTVLTTTGLAAMTTAQVVALETRDVAVLLTTQVRALTTSQISVLTTDQVAALTTAQIESLTTMQTAAITTTQVSHLTLGTPIILDLDGNGVQTLGIQAGVKFDLFADGNSVRTGWVSGGDGLLVLDRNGDGQVKDGSELFGSSTTLANGQRAADGYAALRELDSNQDGVISQDDTAFADLRLWVDGNSDGVSASGELRTLESLGVASINLQTTVGVQTDNGNLVGLTSSYQSTDGSTHAAADVWFLAGKSDSSPEAVDEAIAALAANSPPIAEAASPAPVAAPVADTPAEEAVAPAAVPDAKADLRTRVSSLAQAISQFSENGASQEIQKTSSLDLSGSLLASGSTVSLAAASMADVMKQFDANGNLVAKPGTTAGSATKSLNLPGLPDPSNGGFLTTGGSR